ncbi:hypothetical protein J3A83DRAFT_421569 [Scleroderma citrinum]
MESLSENSTLLSIPEVNSCKTLKPRDSDSSSALYPNVMFNGLGNKFGNVVHIVLGTGGSLHDNATCLAFPDVCHMDHLESLTIIRPCLHSDPSSSFMDDLVKWVKLRRLNSTFEIAIACPSTFKLHETLDEHCAVEWMGAKLSMAVDFFGTVDPMTPSRFLNGLSNAFMSGKVRMGYQGRFTRG